MTAAPPHRYVMLDHWRGLAALSVLAFHAFFPWLAESPPSFRWLAAAAGQGWKGVHLFFVISGYCVAQLAAREIRSGSAAGFFRNRCLRIFPPYWAACLVAAVLALAALPFNRAIVFSSPGAVGALPGSFGELASAVFLLEPFTGQPGYLLVAWTLSWEISFYVLTALLIAIGNRIGPRWSAGIGLAAAIAGTYSAPIPGWPILGGWSEFVCGGCVFFAFTARRENLPAWPWLCPVVVLGFAGWRGGGMASMLPFAAAFALGLFWLHRFDSRLADAKGFAWLGKIGLMSYSLYLIHVPIVSPVRNLLGRVFPPGTPAFLVPVFAGALMSLLGAFFFYRWVETPLERWRKSLPPPSFASRRPA